MLEDYLKSVKYKPASEAQVVYEPITNHLDVSPGCPLPLPSCLQRDLFTPAPGSERSAFFHSFLKLLV